MLVSYLVLPSSARDRRNSPPSRELKRQNMALLSWRLPLSYPRHFMELAWVPKHLVDEALETHYANPPFSAYSTQPTRRK